MIVTSYTNSLIGFLILIFILTASTATRDVITFDFDNHTHFNAHQICPLVKDKYQCDLNYNGEARDTDNKIIELIPDIPNAQRGHIEYYKETLTQLLEKKDYVGLNREVGILEKYITDCEDSFKPTPSSLALENSNFFNIIDMISTFSYLLIHQ
ncbi:hypothetical protein MKX01_018918 [Papaver californicum]|nr:hypothetical protein MKX01_018918 [Papaver californicum]